MNFTGPLPVQFFFQAGYLARWANSFSSGVGVTVAAEGTDGVGVGVRVGTGITVFDGGLSSGDDEDSADGDTGLAGSPELQALTIENDKISTVIRAYWNCLRCIV